MTTQDAPLDAAMVLLDRAMLRVTESMPHTVKGDSAYHSIKGALLSVKDILAALPSPEPSAPDLDLQVLAREIAKDWNGRVLDVWGAIDWIEQRAESDERTGIVIVDRDRAAQSLVAALAAPATPEPARSGEEEPHPIECGICGDYTAQGVEVHQACLEMLSRMAVPPPAAPGLREEEDDLDPAVAAWFTARADAIRAVAAYRASPPEYPGLALVPVADLDRLARYVELPKTRAALTGEPE